jgi:hypothetical protein
LIGVPKEIKADEYGPNPSYSPQPTILHVAPAS